MGVTALSEFRLFVGFVSIAIAIAGCRVAADETPPASPFPSASVIPATPVATDPRTTTGPTVAPTAASEDGRWQAAASMLQGRTGFRAIVLGDGTVLAVGSDLACHPGGAVPGSERAEVYDPVVDAWTEVESLNKPRKIPAAVPMSDGSAMVIGGINDKDFPFSSTKIFSPSSRDWWDGPLLTVARPEPLAAGMAGGRILVLSEGGNGTALTSGEVYEPQQSSWTPAPALPSTTNIHTILTLSDGRVLAMGSDFRDSDPTLVAHVYDPDHESWSQVSAPVQVGFALVALRDGGALAIGGHDAGELYGGTRAMVAQVSRFDPATGRWSAAAPLSTPRVDAQVTALPDGRVLVAGGRTGEWDDTEGVTVRTTELYEPVTNRWRSVGDLLVPRRNGHALALADGTVLLVGGDDDYNTEGDTPWCPEPDLTVERFRPPG